MIVLDEKLMDQSYKLHPDGENNFGTKFDGNPSYSC